MIQILDKWEVKVFPAMNDVGPTIFIVSDNFYSNVLNHVSRMEFPFEVFKIEIHRKRESPTK